MTTGRDGIRVIAFLIVVLTDFVAAHADEYRDHCDRGRMLFAEGKYWDAVVSLELAYRIRPGSQLLYNMAQSYRMLGRFSEAKLLYRIYIAQVKSLSASTRSRIVGYLREMQAAARARSPQLAEPLADLPPEAVPPPPSMTLQAIAEDREPAPSAAEESVALRVAERTSQQLESRRAEREVQQRRRRVWGSAASIAAGIVLADVGLWGLLMSGTCISRPVGSFACESAYQTDTIGGALLVLGLGATSAGIVLALAPWEGRRR